MSKSQFVFGILAVCGILWSGSVEASSASLTSINGQMYIPLAAWAGANGFHGSTPDGGHEFILTSKSSRLVFDVNSVQAEINGVNVRLSFPIAGQKGIPYISELDIRTAIKPLIYPQTPTLKRVTTICLDPGHGGRDTGNRVGSGFRAHNEKTYTLALAEELRRQLQQQGFNVLLTRSSDVYVPLPARPALANARKADLFISLHFNASQVDKGDVAGPETYSITPVGAKSSNDHSESSEFGSADVGITVANRNEDKSLLLAYEMQKSLVHNLHTDDRSVRRARFAVLRDATMPAILIEGGYMTNPAEGQKIYDAAYRQQMAAAIVKGVLSYMKLTGPSSTPEHKSTHSRTTRSHRAAADNKN